MTDDMYTPLFLCSKCNKTSYPLGETLMHFPIIQAPVKCVHCGYKTLYDWVSPEIKNEIIKKKAGITDNPQENTLMKKQIETLEAKFNSLSSEIELIKTKMEILTKDEIEKIKEKAGENTTDIDSLIKKVNDLKDMAMFKEENK